MVNEAQPNATAYSPQTRQDDDKTRKRIRSGEGTVAYWKAKLFRNSYRDRQGNTVEMPEYYVRLRRDGVTKRVRLHSSDKDKAADEALRLSERLREEGWSAVTATQARLPASPTVEEFCDAYKKAAASMERPPRPISVAGYLRHFRQICSLAGISRLRELSPEAVERARDKYRAQGRAAKRDETAIQNSTAMIVRNAAACFSTEARAVLARQGLKLENPFTGIRRTQRIEPVTALPRETVQRIWADLPRLRDGDPDAEEADRSKFARKYRRNHDGRKPRWLPIDFRQPHPGAYCAILLALGAGLRANEIDKARWSWLKFNSEGDNGTWQVKLLPDCEEVRTWSAVFKLATRYAKNVFEQDYSTWRDEFVAWALKNTSPDRKWTSPEVRAQMAAYAASFENNRLRDLRFLKQALFQFLVNENDDAFFAALVRQFESENTNRRKVVWFDNPAVGGAAAGSPTAFAGEHLVAET